LKPERTASVSTILKSAAKTLRTSSVRTVLLGKPYYWTVQFDFSGEAMNATEAAIKVRAKFTGRDQEFHGEREAKTGTIVFDADLNPAGSNFGGGTCGWQTDDGRIYITGLSDLALERKP
jgi:hypothetical protein